MKSGIVAGTALALLAIFTMTGAPAQAQRLFFLIATGPSGGTYFPIGEAIAGLVSHPPGLHRCDAPAACGPPGLIASARTSAGALSNVVEVNAGRVNSGLAQADVVAEAVAGAGAFKKIGPQKQIAIIADLFPEDVHLVAAKGAKITSVEGLKGKRVSLGDPASGTMVTAKAILAAYRVVSWRIKARNLPSDVAAEELENGRLDGFFFVGGAPVGLVRDLIGRGKAVLVPIDGAGRDRLLKKVPSLSAATLPAGIYPDTGAIQTVSVPALWIVNSREPGTVVYAVTKAVFNPANRPLLNASHPSARKIALASAAQILPAPLHPGAARYYREAGVLPHPPAATPAAGRGK